MKFEAFNIIQFKIQGFENTKVKMCQIKNFKLNVIQIQTKFDSLKSKQSCFSGFLTNCQNSEFAKHKDLFNYLK